MSIIFTNGCFDILHRGHIELFRYARNLGNKLIVGLDSDDNIIRDKGFDRPINKAEERKFMLESIRWIDEVYIFQNLLGLESLIRNIRPDIMVIGSDWKDYPVVGGRYAKEIKFFDKIDGYSTTKIIENVKQNPEEKIMLDKKFPFCYNGR
jgi:D-beta-D-heptose 7-phosphate kinase/D-beta-D-heptose 1-phosphate adenosyltransferase